MPTVTDSFHAYWVYTSSPPSRSRLIARLQLQSTHSAGTLLALYLTPPWWFLYGRTPWLRSVLILDALGGCCQRLGFWVMLAEPLWFQVAPVPHCSSFIVGYTEFYSCYNNYWFCWCLRQGFSSWFLLMCLFGFFFSTVKSEGVLLFDVAGVRLVPDHRALGWMFFPWRQLVCYRGFVSAIGYAACTFCT